MRISSSDKCFLLEVSKDELGILSNALNESLACIEDWEYPIRMGVSCEEARRLLREVSRAYHAGISDPESLV